MNLNLSLAPLVSLLAIAIGLIGLFGAGSMHLR